MNRRHLVAICVVVAVVAAGTAIALTGTQPTNNPTLQTNSGVSVTLDGARQVLDGNRFPDDNTVEWVTDSGNVTVSGSGTANLTITQITGTETHVESLNVSNNAVTIDPEDKPAVTVEGETATLQFREMQLDDGTVDFEYSGSSGSTTITVRGLAADTAVAASDSSAVLDKAETDASGTATFTLPNSAHDVTLTTTSLSAPTLSDPDPEGTQSVTPSTLEVNVSDPDFPGDSVEVNVSLDGTQQSSTTITSDTRVSTNIGSLSPGTHTWTVEATDSEGDTTIDSYTFGVPSNITVYNESNPAELINTTEVTATVYQDGDRVFTRSTTNGSIPLRGLPTTEDLIIELNADNYTTRTVIVEDIAIQQRFYLLPESLASFDLRFRLDDPSGRFTSSESQLFIKRPLTVNGTTSFQTIVADEFGPSGKSTVLESDIRYRLVLKNDNNDVRVLGAYEAIQAETVTLQPGGLELNFSDSGGYDWEYRYNNETGNPQLEFEFIDTEDATRNLEVTIHERGNTSNTLSGYPTVYPGPLGTVSVVEPLTAAQANKTWVVEWEADRNGETIDSSMRVSEVSTPFSSLPTWVQVWASLGVILMTGGLFSRANLAVGAMTTALAIGIFWWIGWLSTIATGAGVVVGIIIAAVFWAGNRGV